MKVTVTRTQTQLSLNDKELGFLCKIIDKACHERVRRPLDWLLFDSRAVALYEQLAAITGCVLYQDDAAELSEFYEDAKEKLAKARSAVRYSRNQSRMTVDLKRPKKRALRRRRS